MPVKRQSATLERPRLPESDGVGRAHVTEIQRGRMIAAMIEVVSERGRSDATVAHVVARSGVSRRTFYEVFDDFEDCFLAALDLSIVRATEYVLDGYVPTEKWQVRMGVALRGFLEFLEDEPAMGRLCVVETLGAGSRVHERRLAALEAVTATVDEGRRESRSGRALPSLTSEGVVGGVLSVLHARLLNSGVPTRPTVPVRPTRSTRPISHDEGDPKGAPRARERSTPLLELTGSLMGMVVLPYLGPAAAHKESSRAAPRRRTRARASSGDPLRALPMRLTYRTVRVLLSIAAAPGTSNRAVGTAAGIDDQGQISKLLSRLERLGLIENAGAGQVRGAPNAWMLTKKGFEVERLVARQTSA